MFKGVPVVVVVAFWDALAYCDTFTVSRAVRKAEHYFHMFCLLQVPRRA